jgi:hypothetical protein
VTPIWKQNTPPASSEVIGLAHRVIVPPCPQNNDDKDQQSVAGSDRRNLPGS